MSDLISRQEMLNRLEEWNTDDPTDKALYNFTLHRILEQPTIEPEIVRCKNCKHRHLDDMIWDCPFGLSGGEDFFCAYGAKDGDSDDE